MTMQTGFLSLLLVVNLLATTHAALVGHWAFDETTWNGTAGEVTDSSPTGNDGFAVGGAVTTADGRLARAGSFDGDDDRVTLPSHTSLNLGSTATIATWANFDAIPSGTHRIIGGGSNYQTSFLLSQFGDSLFAYWLNTGPSVSTSSGTLSTEQWYHIVLTNNSGSLNLYLNGQPAGSGTQGSNTFAQQDIYVAGGSNWEIDGRVDDVAIWNTALSVGELRSLYTVPTDLDIDYNVSQLAALWDLHATMGTGTVDGIEWMYTDDLPGSPSPGDAYVFGGHTFLALDAGSGLTVVPFVPEPNSFLLMGVGAVGLLRQARRRRRIASRPIGEVGGAVNRAP